MVQWVRSASTADRVQRAVEWLSARGPSERVLVLVPSHLAGVRLVHQAREHAEQGASFGWEVRELEHFARELAAASLGAEGKTIAPRLSLLAAAAAVLEAQRSHPALEKIAELCDRPGLAPALLSSLEELSLAGAEPKDELLQVLFTAYKEELTKNALGDRCEVLEHATRRVLAGDHPWVGLPTLVLDPEVMHQREGELLKAILSKSPEALLLMPEGDDLAQASLAPLPEPLAEEPAGPLAQVQQQIFTREVVENSEQEAVELLSAPGESREATEILRRVLEEAEKGVPFEEMAVLLRGPELYRTHLIEAAERAKVPAWFARGARRPHASGRALLSLIRCAREGLSASRFAEYLSLGALPGPTTEHAPVDSMASATPLLAEPEIGPVEDEQDHTPPSPKQWERFVVDAAVIGGIDRWKRRLGGLLKSTQLERDELDPDDPIREQLERKHAQLEMLTSYALPLLEELDSWPAEALWGEWIDCLSSIARSAIKNSASLISALEELRPLANLGPIDLSAVERVIQARLSEINAQPPSRPDGKLFVGSVDDCRGLTFQVVFIPGLAEKVFPQKVVEDPLLRDREREEISPHLLTSQGRIERERLRLRLALGAASKKVVASYSRFDLDRGRPRVPSFYALEIVRAAEGVLPTFQELAHRAASGTSARMGWPAPESPTQALDDAEYDLAMLDRLLRAPKAEAEGAAHYLTGTDPRLARALRFRGRRWSTRAWTGVDGLVKPSAKTLETLKGFALTERPYSPTALENFARCPYRFYLRTIMRIVPQESPTPLQSLSPLERGRIVHEVQWRLLSTLREQKRLPIKQAGLPEALSVLAEVCTEVAKEFEELLAPAIKRVWQDATEELHSDLKEWLSLSADDPWVPTHFELGFGLRPVLGDQSQHDKASIEEPVLAGGVLLRGSIDLVEQRDGFLRATDHKTGKLRGTEPTIVGGGTSLQPLLYALVLEQLFPGQTVLSGRLYYCTAKGDYGEKTVELDPGAREAVRGVVSVIGDYISTGFLPAAPAKDECSRCDYRPVCGPYEQSRVAKKSPAELVPLKTLRNLP